MKDEKFYTYSISGTSCDGTERHFVIELPSHEDAIKFLDGRPNCVECTPTWSKDKMRYGGYSISKDKCSKKEFERLQKDYDAYQKLQERLKLTKKERELINRFDQ